MPAQPLQFHQSRLPALSPTLEEDLSANESSDDIHKQPVTQPKPIPGDVSQTLQPYRFPSMPAPFHSLHSHRGSASTTASDSVASSPTAASLAESFSNTDTPATSPDTPASSQSLSSPSLMQATYANTHDKPEWFRQPAPKEFGRPSTAPKKARNLKNLAVDTSGATAYHRPAATASLPLHSSQDSGMVSAPMSPSFMKPIRPPRRKASALGLSIVTPSTDSPPSHQPGPDSVPQTPSLNRPLALRHFPSSPSLELKSPGAPPEGGMQLPPIATVRRDVPVGFSGAPDEKQEDGDDLALDDLETKQIAYPDGPICIYDPHVYLYYEPTAEQASEFNVIFNVASEVSNPFPKQDTSENREETGLGCSSVDVKPFVESQHSNASSQTTPKVNGAASGRAQPEYIHVPWEHNTDIVPDLYGLVKVIDERVQQGKKVLIHCQCGVSRSASLIVAYGLYKNPSITVQEAYDAVKRRSKWIGPNMSLIMQLQEFRSELFKKSAGMPSRHGHKNSKTRTAFNLASGDSKHSDRPEGQSSADGPHSAPLPEDAPKTESVPELKLLNGSITPGPSSAPSGYRWPSNDDDTLKVPSQPERIERAHSVPHVPATAHDAASSIDQIAKADTPANSESSSRRPAKLFLPESHLSRFQRANPLFSNMRSPRGIQFAMAPAKPPPLDDTFGLTSPRNVGVNGAVNEPVAKAVGFAPLQPSEPPTAAIISPRSEEFAMTSVKPPPQDDGLGLTSPRTTTFATQLPQRFVPASSKANALSALYPSQLNKTSNPTSEAGDRAKLRSRLGMSTSSSYDMRSEFVLAAKARELTPMPPPPIQEREDIRMSNDDLDGALMSPRATEFTKNPLHKALGMDDDSTTHLTAAGVNAGENSAHSPAAVSPKDPRSPPQKGVSPIIRNIFDVL